MRGKGKSRSGALTIGEVREATGLTERRIRYYEAQNLVVPRRTAGNQRLYTPLDVERLQRIKQWLDEGLTLRQVRQRLKAEAEAFHAWTDEDLERDVESYFEGKRIARGEPPTSESLYPLRYRSALMRRVTRPDDRPERGQ
ncbi:MAG: MerR family transcriptional regulator [Firmicutes bacterium]|nr:MerR family transcriptional regulator [Alicyclobacillaceae bacterium]MCL6497919.1 MerR family transcriptional regulator [Bacillota bacterium]